MTRALASVLLGRPGKTTDLLPAPLARSARSRALEQQADEHASGGGPLPAGADHALQPEIDDVGAGVVGGASRPLSAGERAEVEPAFGRDFSQVRVHTDSRAAEDMGANAFTLGQDIAFGPGRYTPHTPTGRRLLVHELTHTVQQAQTGQQAVQMDGKTKDQGIGSSPPAESFITMTGSGAEDGHVLFEQDSAELTTAAQRAVLDLVGTVKTPVTVHVHGYASSEGEVEYNRNLSAHRGAAVKRALEGRLPEGSRVVIFAYGGSKEFGSPTNNRRAGVDVIEGVMALGSGAAPKLGFGLADRLGNRPFPDLPPAWTPWTKPSWFDPSTMITPGWLGPPPALGPAVPSILKPRRELMDLPKILGPFTSHGTTPGAFGGNIIDSWDGMYTKYKSWGLSDEMAARLANMELAGTAEAYFQRNSPNALDKSNRAWEAAHPDETKTPIIMSPNLLELFSKKKKR